MQTLALALLTSRIAFGATNGTVLTLISAPVVFDTTIWRRQLEPVASQPTSAQGAERVHCVQAIGAGGGGGGGGAGIGAVPGRCHQSASGAVGEICRICPSECW